MIKICAKCGYEWEYDYVIPEVCPKCGDGHIDEILDIQEWNKEDESNEKR